MRDDDPGKRAGVPHVKLTNHCKVQQSKAVGSLLFVADLWFQFRVNVGLNLSKSNGKSATIKMSSYYLQMAIEKSWYTLQSQLSNHKSIKIRQNYSDSQLSLT